MQSQTSRWTAQELVVLGVFAAAAKISSLLIALAGGGMNPVMLILKNLVFTTLLVVLLTKVPKSGTLLLFTAVTMLVSLLLLGGSVALIPAAFVGAAAGEAAGKLAGGFGLRPRFEKLLARRGVPLFARESGPHAGRRSDRGHKLPRLPLGALGREEFRGGIAARGSHSRG